jgi:hypothetical protein
VTARPLPPEKLEALVASLLQAPRVRIEVDPQRVWWLTRENFTTVVQWYLEKQEHL